MFIIFTTECFQENLISDDALFPSSGFLLESEASETHFPDVIPFYYGHLPQSNEIASKTFNFSKSHSSEIIITKWR